MGVERIAILKYGIDDIQLFYQGDVRFFAAVSGRTRGAWSFRNVGL